MLQTLPPRRNDLMSACAGRAGGWLFGRRSGRQSPRRCGATLLEVVIAVTLLTGLLIPATKMTSGANVRLRRFELYDALLFQAENRLQIAAAQFAAGRPLSDQLDEPSDPTSPRIKRRFTTLSRDANSRTVVAEVWNDDNDNRSLEHGEAFVRLTTVVTR